MRPVCYFVLDMNDGNLVAPVPPPIATAGTGRARRVGVEIEFAGLSVLDAANLVQRLFGGTLAEESIHRVAVRSTNLGDFTVELDASIVHPLADGSKSGQATSDVETFAREALGQAITGIVPVEIVCPPVAWHLLGELTVLFDALRRAGAEGTDDALFYSFGLHLNPEVAEKSVDYVLRHLRAYMIMEDWLRNAIQVDPTRQLLPHIDPFPETYIKRILEPTYAPDLKSLIRDYVYENPTRNRGLDMMPLFRHLDEKTLLSVLDDADLVKARPTFHYRLPNASLSDRTWNAVVEWNRWVQVEELAADTDLLTRRQAEHIKHLSKPLAMRWIEALRARFERWTAG
jgi:hypothetical protein